MNNKQSTSLFTLIISATLFFTASLILHNPWVSPHFYSDIGYVWYRGIYADGTYRGMYGVPYRDYYFEYPPVIALMFMVSNHLTGYSLEYFMVVMGILIYPTLIGIIYILFKLGREIGFDLNRINYVFTLTLSMVIYGFYNWDITVAFFSLLAVYLLHKGHEALSAISLGIAVAAKIIPAVLAPVLFLHIPSWRRRILYALIAIETWLILNIPFILLSWDGWMQLWFHTAKFQLQNTWLLIFLDPIGGKDIGKAISLAIIVALTVLALLSKKSLMEKSSLAIIGFFGATWLFDPQMLLEVTPWFVLSPLIPYWYTALIDILNFNIIVFYFIGGLHPNAGIYWRDVISIRGFVAQNAAARQILVLLAYFLIYFSIDLNKVVGGRLKVSFQKLKDKIKK